MKKNDYDVDTDYKPFIKKDKSNIDEDYHPVSKRLRLRIKRENIQEIVID